MAGLLEPARFRGFRRSGSGPVGSGPVLKRERDGDGANGVVHAGVCGSRTRRRVSVRASPNERLFNRYCDLR